MEMTGYILTEGSKGKLLCVRNPEISYQRRDGRKAHAGISTLLTAFHRVEKTIKGWRRSANKSLRCS